MLKLIIHLHVFPQVCEYFEDRDHVFFFIVFFSYHHLIRLSWQIIGSNLFLCLSNV